MYLILFGVVGFNRFGLDDDGGVATRQRLAFGRYRPRDIARGQSQCHRHSRRNRQCQILNRLHKALFLNVCQFHCFTSFMRCAQVMLLL